MTKTEKILQILLDELPFEQDQSQEYYDKAYQIHSKICQILPLKMGITPDTIIKPNAPLWLWCKNKSEPILANFRTDYPNPCFWEIVDGDYINNSNAIPYETATHFMYINRPED